MMLIINIIIINIIDDWNTFGYSYARYVLIIFC